MAGAPRNRQQAIDPMHMLMQGLAYMMNGGIMPPAGGDGFRRCETFNANHGGNGFDHTASDSQGSNSSHGNQFSKFKPRVPETSRASDGRLAEDAPPGVDESVDKSLSRDDDRDELDDKDAALKSGTPMKAMKTKAGHAATKTAAAKTKTAPSTGEKINDAKLAKLRKTINYNDLLRAKDVGDRTLGAWTSRAYKGVRSRAMDKYSANFAEATVLAKEAYKKAAVLYHEVNKKRKKR